MGSPELDKNGYPTEAILEAIKKWKFEDKAGLIKFIAEAWYYQDSAKETRPGLWTFATGGWSGNEDLIYALQENNIWIAISWKVIQLSGGFYIIPVTEEAEEKLDELRTYIVNWGWDKLSNA